MSIYEIPGLIDFDQEVCFNNYKFFFKHFWVYPIGSWSSRFLFSGQLGTHFWVRSIRVWRCIVRIV